MNYDSDSDSDYIPSTPSSSGSDVTTWFDVIPDDHNIHIDEFGWGHDHVLHNRSLHDIQIIPTINALNDMGINIVSHRCAQRLVEDSTQPFYEHYDVFKILVPVTEFEEVDIEMQDISETAIDGPRIPALLEMQPAHNRRITTTPVRIYTISKDIAPEVDVIVEMYGTTPLILTAADFGL